MRARWLRIAALAALLGASGGVARLADAHRDSRVETSIRYLPDADVLRIASFGWENLTADALWMKLVLYYGEARKGQHPLVFYEQLNRTVVELDPHFLEGYRFGALVLSQDLGDPEAAIDLLRRGMRAMPLEWWLPFEAGFIEYVTNVDELAAYRWFKRAAETPGAGDFPKRFAAFVASRAGDLEVSLVIYRTIAETTSNEFMRKDAEKKVRQLEAALAGEAPVPEWARRDRIVNGRSADDL